MKRFFFILFSILPLISYTQIYYVLEDFEADSGLFTSSGRNSSWEWGNPSTDNINYANSGSKVWATDLDFRHNNLERSYITTTPFDFSALTADPYVGFALRKYSERWWDMLWFEVSTNGGSSWTKLSAASGSLNWYNNTIDEVWEDRSTTVWFDVHNRLTGTAGFSNVLLRFVFISDGGNSYDGFAIDDFYVIAPNTTDLELKRVVWPNSPNFCDRSIAALHRLEVQNKGTSPITSFVMNLQTSGGPVISDTITGVNIPSGGKWEGSFTQPISLNSPNQHHISYWVNAIGDAYASNDSLISELNLDNTYLPVFEDFESFKPGVGYPMKNGWTKDPEYNSDYTWFANVGETPSMNTGPFAGRNGNDSSGVYLFIEGSNSFNQSTCALESPCINATQASGLVLEYYYHIIGSFPGDLIVDVHNGTTWIRNVDIISGNTHASQAAPFLRRKVNLSQFAGNVVQIRIRSETSFGSNNVDIAIDDIVIYELSGIDARVGEVQSPLTGCDLSASEDITIELVNNGSSILDSVTAFYQINTNAIVSQTFNALNLAPNASTLLTFTTKGDFSVPGNYSLKAWFDHPADTNWFNDSIIVNILNETNFPPSNETFESFEQRYYAAGFKNGWVAQPSFTETDFRWNTNAGATLSNATGPNVDYSTATNQGKYVYSEASQGALNDVTTLSSPCYDLRQLTQAEFSFWYHMYGANMGSLHIDLYDGNQWILSIDSILGQQQTNQSDPWRKRTINLNAYTGNLVNLRFRAFRGSNWESDIALDDIEMRDPLSTAIEEIRPKTSSANFFPNPSNGEFTVVISDDLLGESYTILNTKGQEVLNGSASHLQFNVDLSRKGRGVYIIRFDNKAIHQKVIIQ